MEIQNLAGQNFFQKPLVLPKHTSPLLKQDANESQNSRNSKASDHFPPVERAVEVKISPKISDDSGVDAEPVLDQVLPFGLEYNPNGSLPIGALRQGFEEKSAELSGRLRQFFSSHGIQAPVAADLTVDSQGRVIVSNDHKQKVDLEAEFGEDEELSILFNELSASAPVLRAADASADFANIYERNPGKALEVYAHLFSDKFKFNFHFEDGRLSAGFNSLTGSAVGWWQE
jgi:hypothetical protein